MMRTSKDKNGFTLVETIVATVLLSFSVLALAAGATWSMGNIRLNRQREVAASLADQQLTMIDKVGVEEFILLGQTEGVFEEYEPTYTWTVVTESDVIDYLYLVRVIISWTERNKNYSVAVDTMLNGKGLISQVE
jgi:type II secretory pathway pseudopilin PulG